MSLIQLRASLALWRARLKWRSARWKYHQARHHQEYVAKWEKLRLEAIDRIHLRERQIKAKEHPPQPRKFTMYDSVTVSEIPHNAVAVAGYVGGNWPTYQQIVRDFPHAKHLPIAVNASQDAHCLDIETGDASPSQAGPWVHRQKARGVTRPCLYANRSTMPQVLAAIGRAGIKRSEVRLWVADWTGEPHIPAGFDACQYTDRAMGRNLDASLCNGSFL